MRGNLIKKMRMHEATLSQEDSPPLKSGHRVLIDEPNLHLILQKIRLLFILR